MKLNRGKIADLLRQVAGLALFAAGKRDPLAGPFKVQWELTYRCNLRCSHCHIWKPENRVEELSLERCKDIIHELKGMHVLNISFSGGEPLLRKDLFDILEYSARLGIATGLNTNGTLLSGENARKLTEAGLGSAYLSLDGSTAKLHDTVRGVPGTYEKIMGGLEALLSSRKNGKPAVLLNVTIMKSNVDDLYALVRLAHAAGVDGVTFSLLQNVEKYSPNADQMLGDTDIPLLDEQLHRARRDFPTLIAHPPAYFSFFGPFIHDPKQVCSFRCLASYGLAQIHPDGTVYPCPVAFRRLGDLRESSFEQIWRSGVTRQARCDIKAGNHPPCWFDCVAPANITIHQAKTLRLRGILNKWFMHHVARRMK